MLLFRRTFAVPAVMILTIALAVGTLCVPAAARTKARHKAVHHKVAPKAKGKVHVSAAASSGIGLAKLYVPAAMVKGSLVAGGRSFYRSTLPESSLAGIRLGRAANLILARWGNPSRITLGSTQSEVANVPAAPGGPAYIPPGGGSGDLGAALNMARTMIGGPSNAPLPSLGGYEMPGALGMPPPGGPQPGQPGGNETKTLSQEEVTWTYDLQNGITLEFIVTDGIITQITVGGEGPWGLSKTRTGLQLGDSYKLVMWVCGFPKEPQRYVGRFLRVSYVEQNRVLFTFLNKKIVGITVAMVPNELSLK